MISLTKFPKHDGTLLNHSCHSERGEHNDEYSAKCNAEMVLITLYVTPLEVSEEI